MAKILVSLISDQMIPNLQLIKELSDAERHIFISTPEMENKQKSAHLRAAARLNEERVRVLTVAGDSLSDVQHKLAKMRFRDDDHFLVNITGGTKLMSIGVYNFFRDRASEMFYIYHGAQNNYQKVFPDVRAKKTP